MTTAQLQEWKTAKEYYITSQGGVVAILELPTKDRWQEGIKQITLGLHAQGTLYKSLPYKLSVITGHAPGDNAVRNWVRQFQQRYTTRHPNAVL